MNTIKITVKGLVQGIGFRPFIYNLAQKYKINGFVRNRTDAVEILAQAEKKDLDKFYLEIKDNPPILARIDFIKAEEVETEKLNSFRIIESEHTSDDVTEVSPDIAVCEHCLKDMKSQSHRINYPLINCTLCGPRFSIIKSLPYDRNNTTMAPFTMCEKCATEYNSPSNRRFHAQPVACNSCGPSYSIYVYKSDSYFSENIAEMTANMIENGEIVAIKSTGGFHLSCNPFDSKAVEKLREIKKREGKPFAIMFKDIESIKNFAYVNEIEEKLLNSAARPIVLLQSKYKFDSSVNSNLNTIGAMLPSMPFHYLIFEHLKIPAIIMTSGNISDEPIVKDNNIAIDTFKNLADAIVMYNREIHNRVDDSVCAVYRKKPIVLRRARGYAPSPISLRWRTEGVIGVGAELKNSFAIGKGKMAILSQYIGDLKNLETLSFYEEAYERLCSLFKVKPSLVAHDMHPDYLSTHFAKKLGLPLLEVQHHHAHIASCCVENGIEEKVIGVAFDGTGYGTDGTIWGGEFLIADLKGFERYTHFRQVHMPGGDIAVSEIWRMGFSYLYDAFEEKSLSIAHKIFKDIPEDKLYGVYYALQKKINSPLTSGVGRVFDAVGSLCGLCEKASFEAEAAMRLESKCKEPLEVKPYNWTYGNVVDLRETIREICYDLEKKEDVTTISTRFHSTIIDVIVKTCEKIRKDTGLNSVVLSGGCFQNKYIFECSCRLLEESGFKVYTHSQIPCNDGGVALGQLAIASFLRECC